MNYELIEFDDQIAESLKEYTLTNHSAMAQWLNNPDAVYSPPEIAIVREDGEVVGWAGIGENRGRPKLPLLSVFVNNKYRGKGAGEKLCEMVLKGYKEYENIDESILFDKDQWSKMESLIKKAGFKAIPVNESITTAAKGKVKKDDMKSAWSVIEIAAPDFGNPDAKKEFKEWVKLHKEEFFNAVEKAPVKTYKLRDVAKKWRVYDNGRRVGPRHIDTPVIIVNDVAVDGNHRLLTRWEEGKEDVDAVVLKFNWTDVEDMDSQPINTFEKKKKVSAAKGQEAIDKVDESDWMSAFHGMEDDLGPLEDDGGALDLAYEKKLPLGEVKKIKMIHNRTYEMSDKFEDVMKDPIVLFEYGGNLFAEDGQHRINYLILHEGKTKVKTLDAVIIPVTEEEKDYLDELGIRLDPSQNKAGEQEITIESPPHWIK